jgi:protein involved in ribonucleotide reduction
MLLMHATTEANSKTRISVESQIVVIDQFVDITRTFGDGSEIGLQQTVVEFLGSTTESILGARDNTRETEIETESAYCKSF